MFRLGGARASSCRYRASLNVFLLCYVLRNHFPGGCPQRLEKFGIPRNMSKRIKCGYWTYSKVFKVQSTLYTKVSTLKEEIFAGINFCEFFFRYFAGIDFRELGFTEDFAGIHFRELSLTKDFAGINFRESAPKDFAGVN